MKRDKALLEQRSGKLIILVNTPFASTRKAGEINCIPLGMMLLGTILHNAGYRIRIINGSTDAEYREELVSAIREEHPLFIGFSVMSSQVEGSYRITKEIKDMYPAIKIVWGGFHPTIYPQQTVTDTNIDIVVAGEGINVVIPLADALLLDAGLATVPGIFYKEKGDVRFTESPEFADFDRIPDVDWSLVDTQELEDFINRTDFFGENIRSLPLLTGLGCNFRCAFCHNAIFRIKYRILEAERIISNMKYLRDTYDVTDFVLYDEHFFGDIKRSSKLIELLNKEQLGVRFFTSMRASDIRKGCLTKKMLQEWKKAGGFHLGVGAESANSRILEKIKKGITVDDIRKVIELGRDTGIIFTFSFMAGLPGETFEELFDTLDLVNEITGGNSKLGIIGPQIYRPYPGSDLFKEAVSKGLKEPDSLAGWTELTFTSHFRKVEKKALPWIDDFSRFEKIMLCYNIQSYNAPISGLQSLFYWEMLRKKIPFRLPDSLWPRIEKVSNWLIEQVVNLSRWRLRTRNMKLMMEMPIVRFLNDNYFIDG